MKFMYNRGMSFPIRMKLAEDYQNRQKKSFMSNVVGKIKGWFK